MTHFDIWLPRLMRSLFACVISAASGSLPWILYSATTTAMHDRQHDPASQHMPGFLEALSDPYLWQSSMAYLLFVCFIMVAFALPLQALLQKIKLSGYIPVIILAVILGGLLGQILGDMLTTMDYRDEDWDIYKWKPNLGMIGIGMAYGVYHGSVAWLIRRPDKDIRTVK